MKKPRSVLGGKKVGDKPLTLTVAAGKESRTLRDVLVGEVWVCSGQSNMEMGLARGKPSQWSGGIVNYEEEIAAANYPEIRLFQVPRRASGMPVDDVRAAWRVCSPETVPSFSAVAPVTAGHRVGRNRAGGNRVREGATRPSPRRRY